MPRFVVGLAVAFVAVATAAPMRNMNTGQCILAGGYDSDLDEYALRLGSCKNSRTALDLSYNGKAIASDDDYCLSVVDGDVILEACLPSKRQRWTQIDDDQYRNGDSGKCLSVAGTRLVLDDCDSDSVEYQYWSVQRTGRPSPTQTPAPTSTAAPKPTSTLLSCKSVNFVCGSEGTLIDNYCGNPQHPKCSFQRCCKPKPKPLKTCATSGLVCQKYDARPINRLVYCGNSGHPACSIDRCCIRNPRTCASAGVRCPSGSVFINNFCKGPGNPQHPKCDQKRCCRSVQPTGTTCRGWNNCPAGEVLMEDAVFTDCAMGGAMSGLPQCSPSLCCAPMPIQNNNPW